VSATQKLLRFGVFELNLDTEELRKSGTVIKLPPQSCKLLALLASQAGQLVSRDEIQKQLWYEETFVDFEHGVNRCINQIRGVLGDNSDHPLYIETLPRRGYRFVAPVVSTTVAVPRPRVVEFESGERSHAPALSASAGGAPASVAGALAPAFPALTPERAEAAPGPEVKGIVEPRSRVWRLGALWIGALFVLAAVIGGGLYWRAHKVRTLTEKDTVVVAEFDNKTGEAVFDSALRQGLSAQLEQSPFLNLLSDERIAQTLSLMAQPKDARLTGKLAREVCQRTASAAIIEGSIASLGTQYVLGLKAVNCGNGELLADDQVTANGKEQVVKALGEGAKKLRTKLGESLASVQKYDAPAEEVTTASLEALKAYNLGYHAQVVGNNFPSAALLLERAVGLDRNFAMAYARLGTSYFNMGQTARAKDSLRKAYELRERVNERERLYITSAYETQVTGDLVAARKTYELWKQIYPREVPLNDLAATYAQLGDQEAALAAFQESFTLNPRSGLTYGNLVVSYVTLNRLSEAKAAAQAAPARHLDSPTIHQSLYVIAFLQHDPAGMDREAAGMMGKPGLEDTMLYLESDTAAYAGHFVHARELTEHAADSAQRADEKETAAGYVAAGALREALAGNRALAKQKAEEAIALSKDKDVVPLSAIALGLIGDSAQAARLADDLAKRFPEDTIVQFNYLPAIRGAAALGRGSAASAVEALAPATPYELGVVSGSADFVLYPAHLRAEAYLAQRQGTAAAAEFQKVLDHPGAVANEPIGALAHLGLGRAYALSGDPAKAKAAYQDFLTLWKDADPDIPIYKQAKAEYAKLR
jgi:eukaryotic-like serine/threonine-protein kinase